MFEEGCPEIGSDGSKDNINAMDKGAGQQHDKTKKMTVPLIYVNYTHESQ